MAMAKATNGVKEKSWMEKAWPEGAEAFGNLYSVTQEKGVLDPKTRLLIMLAAASLQRCRHCVSHQLERLKTEVGATDREIAEAMMLASLSAAGTNLAWAKEVFEERLG